MSLRDTVDGINEAAWEKAMDGPVYRVGDVVDVLHSCARHITVATGAIERITRQSSDGTPLYWIAGVKCARTESVLRYAGVA